MNIIRKFTGKYNFLSNYYEHNFKYGGHMFRNSEAAFQSQKDPTKSHKFVNLSANDAKSLGHKVKLRSDWETVKDSIMEDVLRAKFSDKCLKDKLMATHPCKLFEGNTCGDMYWGIDIDLGIGENKLGKILMKLRSEYINEL